MLGERKGKGHEGLKEHCPSIWPDEDVTAQRRRLCLGLRESLGLTRVGMRTHGSKAAVWRELGRQVWWLWALGVKERSLCFSPLRHDGRLFGILLRV